MKKLVLFILLGLLFAAPGEILNQVLARNDPRAFGATMISYSVLLLIGFFVSKGISAMFPNSAAKSRLVYYLLFGFLGLMVEWFLLGNTPVLDPLQVITQPGMFTFWGTMLVGPCLMLEPDLADLKRSFAKFFTASSLLYLMVAVIVPRAKGGIFFGFILFAAGSVALNYFYIKYFRRLAGLRRPGVSPHF
jgi:hypothetical protein